MKQIAYYQNITGEEREKQNRLESAYWNEGKWKNFINPLLPTENRKDMTLIEVGCNNGLFLKLAKEAGFRKAIGIEADAGAVERGIKYRDSLGMDYEIYNRAIGKDFSFDELPLADVYLLSNVHYYFQLNDWLNFIDRVQFRTVYILIVTRPILRSTHHWRPKSGIEDVKYYFRDWEGISARYRIRSNHMDRKDDPSPRVLWSLLFKSKLKRKRFEELRSGARADIIAIPRDELFRDVIANPNIDLTTTSYYKAWRERMSKEWDEKTTFNFVKCKADLIRDLVKNGQKDPAIIDLDGKIIDGGHRCSILKGMGYESVITRQI